MRSLNPNLKYIIILRSLAGTLKMVTCNFPETFLWNIANFNLSAFSVFEKKNLLF